MKFKILLLTGFVCFYSLGCFSQSREFNFINYTQENGLPSNETYFIYRDSKNFLWVASDKGVVRFDGNRMENFELPDNVVFKIREDSKGRIWFFSHTGRFAYYYNGRINPYRYNDNVIREIKGLVLTDAYVTDDDEIVINSGLYKNYKISKSGKIETYAYFTNSQDSFRMFIQQLKKTEYFAQVRNLSTSSTDPIVITIKNSENTSIYRSKVRYNELGQYGCKTYDGQTFFIFIDNHIIRVSQDGAITVKQYKTRVLSIMPGKAGTVWVGLEKFGAILADSNLNQLYYPSILRYKSISSIAQDYEGGTWFSTLENGIYYLRNMHVGYFTLDSSINTEVFRLHCLKKSDELLYAKQDGLYALDSAGTIKFLKEVENSKISDLFSDNRGNIYMAGKIKENGILAYSFIKKKITGHNLVLIPGTSEVKPILNDRFFWSHGAFLMNAAMQDTIKYKKLFYDKIPGIRIAFEPAIPFVDDRQQAWAGSTTNLYKINPGSGLPLVFEEKSGLFQKGITCMRQLNNGIYIIGVRFGGIALMEGSKVIANITEKEGLLNNSVKYLLVVENQLWAATAKGISVIQFSSYSPLRYSITNIGKSKGFYNLITNQLIQYKDNILAATSNGIYFIDKPAEILNEDPAPIPLYINSISYYKGDTTEIAGITLPHNKNRVTIRYAALCFNSPGDMKYYYRFDNNDTTWRITNNTELLLENLSPGKYDLQLKAALSGGKRISTIKKLKIVVEKAWWQNNWLWLGILLICIGAVYLVYRRRIHFVTTREKERSAINTRMLELEQTALRSQMNPHFIFNCLTSIQQLIISGNKTEANEYLVKFARLIRKTLELSGNTFISVAEEIDYIREYLALEQLRIPGQFDFEIDTDPDIQLNHTEIPGMMLQPIVENSIRHGIKHLENGKGHIAISLLQQDDFILCTVTDNGVGRGRNEQKDNSYFRQNKSYGMQIVAKRLATITGTQPVDKAIEITDLFNADGSPSGTSVTMKLPYKNNRS